MRFVAPSDEHPSVAYRVHDMIITDPALFRVCISTRQEQDEIRFMKGWQFRELEKVLSPWQIRQCREIKNECWG